MHCVLSFVNVPQGEQCLSLGFMKPVTVFPMLLQSGKARVALVSGLCGFSPTLWYPTFGSFCWLVGFRCCLEEVPSLVRVRLSPSGPDWHGAHYVEEPGLGRAVTPSAFVS